MLQGDIFLFEREREVCISAKGGNGGGNWRGLMSLDLTNLLGFITNVSLTANTHCMADGLTLMVYQTMQWCVICYQWFKP